MARMSQVIKPAMLLTLNDRITYSPVRENIRISAETFQKRTEERQARRPSGHATGFEV